MLEAFGFSNRCVTVVATIGPRTSVATSVRLSGKSCSSPPAARATKAPSALALADHASAQKTKRHPTASRRMRCIVAAFREETGLSLVNATARRALHSIADLGIDAGGW